MAARRGNERGSALIIALSVILLLAGFSLALVTSTQTHSLRVQVDLEDFKAFEAAEAGIDMAINDINRSRTAQIKLPAATAENPTPSGQVGQFSPDGRPLGEHVWTTVWATPGAQNGPGCLGTENWRPMKIARSANTVIDKGDDTLAPITGNAVPANYISRPRWPAVQNDPQTGLPVTPEKNIAPKQLGDVYFFTYAVAWLHDGIDNNGDGFVDDITERNKYTLYSSGIHKGGSRSGVTSEGRVVTVEAVTEALDIALWPVPDGALEIQVPTTPAPPVQPEP